MTDASNPSAMLILQRIRNRITEYFELASSYQEQRAYDAAGSIAFVPNEIINQWEYWVNENWRGCCVTPVFSAEEQAAVADFDAVWNAVADETPNPLPPLECVIGTEPWERLRIAATGALCVFRVRGKLSEDHEDFSLPFPSNGA